jgi:hypothetical protein
VIAAEVGSMVGSHARPEAAGHGFGAGRP